VNQLTHYHLRLYLVGGTDLAETARAALASAIAGLRGRVRSEVIDVLTHPELFFDPGLEPVPVLVRVKPEPTRVYRGPFSDPDDLARFVTEE